MGLNVQTISTQAAQSVAVNLGAVCQQVLIKNFGTDPVWVSTDQNATKTQGSVRIPGGVAQVLCVNTNSVWPGMTFDTLYVYADTAGQDNIEVQPIKW